ncbi:transcription factor bHLH93-like [Rhodamnia argentea]|uniref:Transcription factor bHLH93-like n=1 Tax=Rhodamnia argentea TaxID=178133 RepID=A0A8B8P2A0_9MYRT|nr:transcription factor bHLH93-like [Rhodamnia argentea]
MEHYEQHGFLEELLAAQRRSHSHHPFETNPTEMNDLFFSNAWASSHHPCFDDNPSFFSPSQAFSVSPCLDQDDLSSLCFPSGNEYAFLQQPHMISDSSYSPVTGPQFTDSSYSPREIDAGVQEDQFPLRPLVEEDEPDPARLLTVTDDFQGLYLQQATCKVEPVVHQESPEAAAPAAAPPGVFNMGGSCLEGKSRAKKVEGQPSKNLMAERRRRKRLNDRLSMLRSIVPKISKMDRTSILGDTIDYVKELTVKINSLQQESKLDLKQLNVLEPLKEMKPSEVSVRNSPQFEVERRNEDTRIEICCAGKPGLLLSTISTMEALGLEIEQCVISCFSDFAIQASCSEGLEQRSLVSSEDMKQALFRNAGYGGRCL